jgi:WD40 repeat protein
MSIMRGEHAGAVYSVKSDRGGERVVTASEDGAVRLFKVERGRIDMRQELLHHKAAVFDAIFVGEKIVSCSYDGEVVVWRQNGSQYTPHITKHLFQGSINCICSTEESEDIYKIFCGCSDGKIRVMAVKGDESSVEEHSAHRFGITALATDKKCLMSGGMDCAVKMWDPESMEMTSEIKDHGAAIRDCKFAEEAFGIKTFATCGEDGNVFVYSKASGNEAEASIGKQLFRRERIEIGEPCYKLSWSKAGYSLCVAYGMNRIRAFSPEGTGKWEEVSLL